MSELRFEELPDIPRIWIDFLRSRLSFLPASCQIQTLPAHVDAVKSRVKWREDIIPVPAGVGKSDSPATLETIQRLRQSESVVVIANFYWNVLGGPAFQIWKCLTAIKVCEELAKHGHSAVPVCWIHADPPFRFSNRSINLLDAESELHCLQLQADDFRDLSPRAPLLWQQISELISQIEKIGRGAFDAEVLDILRSAFTPEATFSLAAARMIARLIGEWGMIVLDAGTPEFEPVLADMLAPISSRTGIIESLLQKRTEELANAGYTGEFSIGAVYAALVQSLALPVAVNIIDPYEVYSYAASLPIFNEVGLPKPLAWPQSSVTIVDARSRRILERYNLGVHQLYSGEEEIIGRINGMTIGSAPDKLNNLKSEVETILDELHASDSGGEEFAKSADACKEKILYQLEKLRAYCVTARARKEETASRQIHKACNFLAPRGSVQERELAGILFPLRYSRAGFRHLYEKLDILKLEHQLIAMD